MRCAALLAKAAPVSGQPDRGAPVVFELLHGPAIAPQQLHQLEPRGALRPPSRTGAEPLVDGDVVVIAPGREEHRIVAAADRVEAERLLPPASRTGCIAHLHVHVADARARRCPGPERRQGPERGHDALEVEPVGAHLHLAIDPAPARLRGVGVDLDPVALGIGEVDRLADPVIGGAVDRDAPLDRHRDPVGEIAARGKQDGGVKEARLLLAR